ncbi:MAG: hypothetical protein Q7J85_09920, partial [Bacillota bacterium]|nr:hypothetical protein [Bacillota bacterium]
QRSYASPSSVANNAWAGFRVVNRVAVIAPSLTFTVYPYNFVGDITTIPVTVDLGNGIDPIIVYPDADGRFTVNNIEAGTYDIRIKASHWLAKAINGVGVVSGNKIINPIELVNGDVVDNNEVDFSDINAVRAAYGSFPGDETWNELADVDGTGEVDFTDINIVRSRYGEIGD